MRNFEKKWKVEELQVHGTSDDSKQRLTSQPVKNIVISPTYFPPKRTFKRTCTAAYS
jgi:hypothetical protein